jgi:hypothetical protein
MAASPDTSSSSLLDDLANYNGRISPLFIATIDADFKEQQGQDDSMFYETFPTHHPLPSQPPIEWDPYNVAELDANAFVPLPSLTRESGHTPDLSWASNFSSSALSFSSSSVNMQIGMFDPDDLAPASVSLNFNSFSSSSSLSSSSAFIPFSQTSPTNNLYTTRAQRQLLRSSPPPPPPRIIQHAMMTRSSSAPPYAPPYSTAAIGESQSSSPALSFSMGTPPKSSSKAKSLSHFPPPPAPNQSRQLSQPVFVNHNTQSKPKQPKPASRSDNPGWPAHLPAFRTRNQHTGVFVTVAALIPAHEQFVPCPLRATLVDGRDQRDWFMKLDTAWLKQLCDGVFLRCDTQPVANPRQVASNPCGIFVDPNNHHAWTALEYIATDPLLDPTQSEWLKRVLVMANKTGHPKPTDRALSPTLKSQVAGLLWLPQMALPGLILWRDGDYMGPYSPRVAIPLEIRRGVEELCVKLEGLLVARQQQVLSILSTTKTVKSKISGWWTHEKEKQVSGVITRQVADIIHFKWAISVLQSHILVLEDIIKPPLPISPPKKRKTLVGSASSLISSPVI